MISQYIYAALAEERRLALTAEASSQRVGRPRHTRRRNRVVLPDGSQVLIRPLRPSDAPSLVDGFSRLSVRSRRARFFTAKTELTLAEQRFFTDVDHHDHEALGAIDITDGRGVGVARFVRNTEDPQAAEIAVTVVDEWQGRGLGTELLARLTERAHDEGIRRFTAMVAADNVPMQSLLGKVPADVDRVSHDDDVDALEYELTLTPCGGTRD